MLIRIGKYLLSGAFALLCCVTTEAIAAEQLEALLGDVSEYWAPIDTELETEQPAAFNELSTADEEVTPVQMLTPQRNLSPRVAQRSPRSAVARRNPNLSSVPFMIGDTGAGSCISYGNLLNVDLGHPTLGCSRLNISEGNTPLPTDRVFFSYRHFQNSTPTSVFEINEDFNIDRFTLGGERTFFNGMMSAEIRLPIDHRLTSNLRTNIVSAPPQIPGAVVGFDPIFGGKRTELANISMIFKALLIERSNCAITAGLGVTMPTARDVTYDVVIDDFVINDIPGIGNVFSLDQIVLNSIASNETFYLSPFLAWLWQPNPRFFHQGFMQVEVAANSSFFTVVGAGQKIFDTSGNNTFGDAGDTTFSWTTPPNALSGGTGIGITKLQPQTLLRLNLGCGYVLTENPNADWIQKLTSLFEVHYTTTLSSANINSIATPITGPGFAGLDSIDIGNRDNRVDIVNVVAGLSANMGNWVVTNGFTAPITTGSNRGFDFEYNLQVQRPF